MKSETSNPIERAWRPLLALLAVYAAPLVIVVGGQVKKHPWLALLFAMAWLAIVTVAWLFWRVAAEPINRRLRELSTAFDRILDRRLSRYGREYSQWVMASRRFLDAKGLATVGTFSPELDEVFVDVRLTARAPSQVSPGLLGPAAAEDAGRQSIWDFLDQAEPVVLAVLGAPGSGKTTLLNYVARHTARTPAERRRPIPVLLQLRDHADAVAGEPTMPLSKLIRLGLPSLPVPEPGGWWESRLTRGKCVVLLDGLDEVASADKRRAVVAWVNQQVAIFPRNDFVVTSRPHGYRDEYVESATTLQVLSFTPDQVHRFLHGWYLAVERRATGTTGREVEMLAREAADDLLDRLAATPALYELTINPLLLTMIANVHRYRRSLPNSRADLYGEVCQVMLWRRQEAKRIDLNLPGIGKERLLAWLAFEMMKSGTRDISRRKLFDGISPRLRRISTEVAAEDFVHDVGSNGLLVERGRDLYAFAHLTFQEYLAARYIQDQGLERVLIDAVDNPWWRETTLLYLAGADADAIVESALRSATPAALSLAFECAEIGAELAPELRERLAEVLKDAFAPGASAESRRLVAGVLANRYLRKLVATPSGTHICPDPVESDLYWLFRMDTRTPPPDGRPEGGQHSPVRGLWSTDAAAFVTWINAVGAAVGSAANRGTGVLYRLPTPDELDALAHATGPSAQVLRSRGRRVWARANASSTPAVWAPPGEPSTNVVSAGELLSGAVADLRQSRVLIRLLSATATEAVRRLQSSSVPLQSAADELAQSTVAIRSGSDAGGLENSSALDDLRRELGFAHEAATALDRALRDVPGIESGVAVEIDRILSRHTIARTVESLEKAASLGRDVAIAQEWNRDMGVDSVLPQARAIRGHIDRARRRLRELWEVRSGPAVPPSLLEHRLGMDVDPVGFAGDKGDGSGSPPRNTLGISLSMAVTALLEPRATERTHDSVTRLAAALLHFSAAATPEPIPVDLGRLAEMIRPLPDSVLLGGSSPIWARTVLRRLHSSAAPILARQQPMTADAALAIRVPALVLAAEAMYAHDEALAAMLRRLAAATCLMRRRTRNGYPMEALVLATA
ncbi:NACHT domain-containing protein [Actinoplanes sp. KI2]|uniref:NACHT domain-containing protein n=1 Tax=Actinoplanes sp. KI2 TaxID=2983315 RepID=UPI0021D5A394|nr:NACHT domain-containing protein [Actinoplanes sp. KI2]MCU7722651.1 NACHT domain-containing protein [Actinoplanes sp. KI2]